MRMKQASNIGTCYFIYVPSYARYHDFQSLYMRHPNNSGTLENFISLLAHEEFFEMYRPELPQSEMYLSIFMLLKLFTHFLMLRCATEVYIFYLSCS